eukprot:UN25320
MLLLVLGGGHTRYTIKCWTSGYFSNLSIFYQTTDFRRIYAHSWIRAVPQIAMFLLQLYYVQEEGSTSIVVLSLTITLILYLRLALLRLCSRSREFEFVVSSRLENTYKY